MGRQRARLILPKQVARVMDIIELILDCHPAGYLVLAGRADWPDDEEFAEMMDRRSGEPVHVQGGAVVPEAQRHVELLEAAHRRLALLDRYGGPKAVAEAVNNYRLYDPETAALLRKIGSAGMPGAKSLERLAEECHMDDKTLSRVKDGAIRDIAYFIVFGGEEFELLS